MEQPVQISLFDYLAELEGNDREIEIKGAINTKKSLKEIEGVRLSYGDLTLIVAMIRDYVRGLDEVKQDDIQWQAYYRKKFWDMAEKISDQIGYDYDLALKKCLKKQEKESDIGEDALKLALKRAPKPQKQENTEENTEKNTGEPEKGEQKGNE